MQHPFSFLYCKKPCRVSGCWQGFLFVYTGKETTMGMDVYGLKNSKAYFRANIWSWRPIHAVIAEVASDFIPEKVIHAMSFNDGAGLESEEDCKKLASRISAWLEHNVDGKKINPPADSFENSLFEIITKNLGDSGVSVSFGTDNKNVSSGSGPGIEYYVSDTHLKKFVEFLNICGGFKVC